VSEPSLAAVAREIGLGEYLLVGRGEEQTGGRDKDSLLADSLEALVASLYLDGGIARAGDFITRFFSARSTGSGAPAAPRTTRPSSRSSARSGSRPCRSTASRPSPAPITERVHSRALDTRRGLWQGRRPEQERGRAEGGEGSAGETIKEQS